MPIPSPIRRRKPTVVQSVQCQHCRLTLNVKYQPHPSTIVFGATAELTSR